MAGIVSLSHVATPIDRAMALDYFDSRIITSEMKRRNLAFLKRVGYTYFTAEDVASKTVMCSICLKKMKKGQCVYTLPCEHTFHYSCMRKWYEDNGKCPVCMDERGQASGFGSDGAKESSAHTERSCASNSPCTMS